MVKEGPWGLRVVCRWGWAAAAARGLALVGKARKILEPPVLLSAGRAEIAQRANWSSVSVSISQRRGEPAHLGN